MGIVYIFSPFGNTRDNSHIILTLSCGILNVVFNAKFPRRLSIFGCVLKPTAVEGAFQNRLSGHRPY